MSRHIYTVVRQVMLAAPPETAWRHLTAGALLREWFADSDDLTAGGEFTFAFGDGDFFAGVVTEWDEPVSLGLTWRFLNVGPSFDIRFALLPVEGGTELSVIERGSASVAEAAELRDGWDDFLMRCEKRVRKPDNCRYRWTEPFGATAFLTGEARVWALFRDPQVWQRHFPTAAVEVNADDRRLVLEFSDPAWGAVRTAARVRTFERAGRTCLAVTHEGWGALPFDTQVSERRRYGGYWAQLLEVVEEPSRDVSNRH